MHTKYTKKYRYYFVAMDGLVNQSLSLSSRIVKFVQLIYFFIYLLFIACDLSNPRSVSVGGMASPEQMRYKIHEVYMTRYVLSRDVSAILCYVHFFVGRDFIILIGK